MSRQRATAATPEAHRFNWDWEPSEITVTEENFEEMQQRARDGMVDSQNDVEEGNIVPNRVRKVEELFKKIEDYKLRLVLTLSKDVDKIVITKSNLKAVEELVKVGRRGYDILAPSDSLGALLVALKVDILVDKIAKFRAENGLTEMTNVRVEET